MITIEEETSIDRPPAEVFAFIADVDNLTRWQSGTVEAALLSEPPLRLGSRFRQVVKAGPWKLQSSGVVTEYSPSEVFAVEAMSGPLDYACSIRLKAAGGGTRVTMRAVAHANGFWRFLEPLFAGDLKKEARSELKTLRNVLQTAPVA